MTIGGGIYSNARPLDLNAYRLTGTTPASYYYLGGRQLNCAAYAVSVTPPASKIYAMPFYSVIAGVVDLIAIRQVGNGGAACVGGVAIYNNRAQVGLLQPGSLVAGTNFTWDASAGSPKVVNTGTIAVPFSAGALYWFCYTDNAGSLAVASPAYRGVTASNAPPIIDTNSTLSTDPFCVIRASYVSADGTIPDPFPDVVAADYVAVDFPMVGVHFAS